MSSSSKPMAVGRPVAPSSTSVYTTPAFWVWAWLIFLALWFVIGAVVLIFETIRSAN